MISYVGTLMLRFPNWFPPRETQERLEGFLAWYAYRGLVG